jgi:hypothetical protein
MARNEKSRDRDVKGTISNCHWSKSSIARNKRNYQTMEAGNLCVGRSVNSGGCLLGHPRRQLQLSRRDILNVMNFDYRFSGNMTDIVYNVETSIEVERKIFFTRIIIIILVKTQHFLLVSQDSSCDTGIVINHFFSRSTTTLPPCNSLLLYFEPLFQAQSFSH